MHLQYYFLYYSILKILEFLSKSWSLKMLIGWMYRLWATCSQPAWVLQTVRRTWCPPRQLYTQNYQVRPKSWRKIITFLVVCFLFFFCQKVQFLIGIVIMKLWQTHRPTIQQMEMRTHKEVTLPTHLFYFRSYGVVEVYETQGVLLACGQSGPHHDTEVVR